MRLSSNTYYRTTVSHLPHNALFQGPIFLRRPTCSVQQVTYYLTSKIRQLGTSHYCRFCSLDFTDPLPKASSWPVIRPRRSCHLGCGPRRLSRILRSAVRASKSHMIRIYLSSGSIADLLSSSRALTCRQSSCEFLGVPIGLWVKSKTLV